MDFLDKLGKKASETYKFTAEKTSKIAKEAKIKMTMNENKSKIEELYVEIGKKMYEHHVNPKTIDIDMESVLEDYCIQIDELCDRIEDERKELLSLKDKKQCPNCFSEIELSYKYCPNCGDKQSEEPEEISNNTESNESTKDTDNSKKQKTNIDEIDNNKGLRENKDTNYNEEIENKEIEENEDEDIEVDDEE